MSPSPAPSRTLPDEPPGTRTRLLDAAERLFAEHGIAGTSLRRITREAAANLAAVNYHFGSKAGLIEEVYRRRIGPLNEERLRRLRAALREAGDGPPPLEAILEAFLAPVQDLCTAPGGAGSTFLRLVARVNLEPAADVRRVVYRQFEELASEFLAAFRRALPALPPETILARFGFALGATFFTLTGLFDAVRRDARPDVPALAREEELADLVAFLAAGFRVPPGGDGA